MRINSFKKKVINCQSFLLLPIPIYNIYFNHKDSDMLKYGRVGARAGAGVALNVCTFATVINMPLKGCPIYPQFPSQVVIGLHP
jgi:hypothetical protein